MLIDPDCELFDDSDDEDDDCCTECGSAINLGQCGECVDCCEECRKDYSEWQYNNKDVVSHYLREDPDLGIIAAFIDNANKVQVKTLPPPLDARMERLKQRIEDTSKMVFVIAGNHRQGIDFIQQIGRTLSFKCIVATSHEDVIRHNKDSYAYVTAGTWASNPDAVSVKLACQRAGLERFE
jgi:hypothetical protein